MEERNEKILAALSICGICCFGLCACGAPSEDEIYSAVKDTFPDNPKLISVECLDYGDESDTCTIDITVDEFSENETEAAKQYEAVMNWVDYDKPDNADYPGFEKYSIAVNKIYSGDDSYERETNDMSQLCLIKNGKEMVWSESNNEDELFGSETPTKADARDKSDMDDDEIGMVVAIAKDITKGQLKAPSTAKFPASFDDYTIENVEKEYIVGFEFEAENSYGTPLAHTAVITFKVKKKSDDGWKYVEEYADIQEK